MVCSESWRRLPHHFDPAPARVKPTKDTSGRLEAFFCIWYPEEGERSTKAFQRHAGHICFASATSAKEHTFFWSWPLNGSGILQTCATGKWFHAYRERLAHAQSPQPRMDGLKEGGGARAAERKAAMEARRRTNPRVMQMKPGRAGQVVRVVHQRLKQMSPQRDEEQMKAPCAHWTHASGHHETCGMHVAQASSGRHLICMWCSFIEHGRL